MENMLSAVMGAVLGMLFVVSMTSTEIDVSEVNTAVALCDPHGGAVRLRWNPSGGIRAVKCKDDAVFTVRGGER